jgi:hypothetical protein
MILLSGKNVIVWIDLVEHELNALAIARVGLVAS